MRIMTIRGSLVGVALSLAASVAFAQEVQYSAELSGDQQVPPVETEATGSMEGTYDPATMTLSWTAEHSGLSGEPTAAHFHGPAEPGENAPPVVPIDLADLAEGSATLTEEQAAQLEAGELYLNIHTEANPDGEIRGQVTAAQ